MEQAQHALLVSGASGQLGRLVLDHLLDTLHVSAARLFATTRRPESLADYAARGVTIRQADFDDTGALAQAFRGAQRLLLISTDAVDVPGQRIAQHRNAIAAAQAAGVAHLVYTSMPEPEGSPILMAPDHLATEQALAASGLAHTILRNGWYYENLFLALPQVLASGQWFTAAGLGRIAHIARDDLALAAAHALASDASASATYTLTGAQAYTIEEIAALVSAVAGKPISVVQVPETSLIQGMVAAGLPETYAAILASFDTNTREGRVAAVTGDFGQLTGRPPQDYRVWLARQRDAILATGAPS